MTNEEIKVKVAEYRKKAENKSMPESARKKFTEMADNLEKELKAEKKTEVKDKDKVASAKKVAPAKVTPAKKAPAKKAAPAKKEAAKKTPVKKVAGEKKEFTYKGEKVSQETVTYCLGLVEEWRKKRAAKADRTPAKKETPSEVVGKKVVAAVKEAVETIPDKIVIEQPKKVVTKIERLADAAEEFLAAFKEVLGDKFDKAKIEKEMKPIYILIEDIKEKYL